MTHNLWDIRTDSYSLFNAITNIPVSNSTVSAWKGWESFSLVVASTNGQLIFEPWGLIDRPMSKILFCDRLRMILAISLVSSRENLLLVLKMFVDQYHSVWEQTRPKSVNWMTKVWIISSRFMANEGTYFK